MMDFIRHFNTLIFWCMTAAYFYQLVYMAVGLKTRNGGDFYQPKKLHKFAAVIAARNEASVIEESISNLKGQGYPRGLLDVFVVADNCTDATARIARRAGAVVYERRDTLRVGKGFALDFLLKKILENHADAGYEGFFIFDADNLISPDFVPEMNRMFDRGYKVVTCYRNSKNFGTNWITAGYSLWFLREARFLNSPRMRLNTSCAVSGTGFLVSADIIRNNCGWRYHLLTEDIEFSVNCALRNEPIGYCENAVLYDEQPTTFRQSWRQRMRWTKGFYQVIAKYGLSLARGIFKNGRFSMSCYDMLMTVAPGALLMLLCAGVNFVVLLYALSEPATYMIHKLVLMTASTLTSTLVNSYLLMFLYGLLTALSEWKRIKAATWQKLVYLFTFPVFMFTYAPISVAALVSRVEWKPIPHSVTTTLRELQ